MPRDDDRARGAGAWARRWWRALAAEAAATALLMWLGAAALVPMDARAGPPPLAHAAMAFGCVVVGNAVAFGGASGAHMNPAVTLAAALQGRLGAAAAAAYVAAQLAGAVLGFGALLATLPAAAPAGVTRPAAAVGAPAAAALEAAVTALLALACCAAWADHDRRGPDPALPLKLGLLVAGLIYAAGPATGASLNPARSFAPALLHNHWAHHWVYWVGPLSGAALAALLHRFVLAPPAPAPAPGHASAHAPAHAHAPADEELPLADKP